MMNMTSCPLLYVPLTTESHRLAMSFAKSQPTIARGKQVYLSILAVLAVHDYFKWLGIETDYVNADCWRPTQQAIAIVADLNVTRLGKLECCPVLPGSDTLTIPVEASDERVGYIGVLLSDRLDSAAILGFHPVRPELTQLPLSELQPLETVFDHMAQAVTQNRQMELEENARTAGTLPLNPHHNLRQWFEMISGQGWCSLEELLSHSSEQLAYSMRHISTRFAQGFKAGKLINLGVQLRHQVVLLLIGFSLEEDDRMNVSVRLCTGKEQDLLPAGLQLILRSETGAILKEVQEMIATNYLQLLPFKVNPGTQFSVEIQFADAVMTEYFVA